MKYRLDIKEASSQEWIDCVMSNFNSFLQDHADCERKASAMAMSFVAKYPDRVEIIPELIETAIEELEHFQMVYRLMQDNDISLPSKMAEDPYIKALIGKCHSGRKERFLDKLLMASIVETRGAERFKMVADRLPEGPLKDFYKMLWASEARHGEVYVRMALNYFSEAVVYDRMACWVEEESLILSTLEIRPALH
jgi:tRNA-(ms[2]io[6]A)-hydroxylase